MKIYYNLPLLFLLSCTPKPQPNTITISLTANKQSLQFKGLDPSVMGEISRDSAGSRWQQMMPVYRLPADTDLKAYQPVQPGKYQLAGNAVIFTPDTPFVKGQPYFVRYYRFGDNTTLVDYLKGRNRMGKPSFTDLIFKQ